MSNILFIIFATIYTRMYICIYTVFMYIMNFANCTKCCCCFNCLLDIVTRQSQFEEVNGFYGIPLYESASWVQNLRHIIFALVVALLLCMLSSFIFFS